MNRPLKQHHIVVKKSAIEGYGVFALKDIKPKEIIEECYTLFFSTKNKPTQLADYLFGVEEKWSVLSLGYGSIYNHSDKPNADYYPIPEKNLMVFSATRLIKAGDEIFISYGEDWFSSRDTSPKKLSFWQKNGRHYTKIFLRVLVIIGGLYGLSHL